MTKTKTPFLSLGSRGTVGQALTSQKRGDVTLLREKPIPAYLYTLPQAYQRWLYEDYAYLWTQQSAATRRAYAADGVRFHLTGFQYWMKYQLTNLPDIAGFWKLDRGSIVYALDASRNLNRLTIIGASPADGLIDRALYFDGLNDRLIRVVTPSLTSFTAKSLDFFIKPTAFTGAYRYPYHAGFNIAPYGDDCVYEDTTNRLRWELKRPDGTWAWTRFTYTPDIWIHACFTWDGQNLRSYKDGSLAHGPIAFTGTIDCSSTLLSFGAYTLGWWAEMHLDNIIIYNRALDPTEVKRHSERRYPP